MSPIRHNKRGGVDAGCAVLFAFGRACSGTTHRERWPAMPLRMLSAIFLSTLLLTGCLHDSNRAGGYESAFNIRSSDVISASAEPRDPGKSTDYKAHLRLQLSAEGLARLQQFIQARHGQEFELRINGEVLLPAVGTGAIPSGSEISWYAGSLGQAKRRAASLNGK